MKGRSGVRAAVALAAMLAALLPHGPASSSLIPQAGRGLVPPVGFGLTEFAETPGLLPTSLTFGPDGRLYVAAIQGVAVANGFQVLANGQILAFDNLGGRGGPPEIVAEDFEQLLGITFGPDGTLYAADNAACPGPCTGRIQALRDANNDGVYEVRRTLLQNIPRGRHQTNGMAFGPDGMLYVANGNATDDGIECGPPDGAACDAPEKKPWTGAILRVNPAWEDVDLQKDVRVDADGAFADDGLDDESVLVSPGYRNIYDVDFWPGDPSMIYTPMNGSDFPASNEPLFRLDVDNTEVVGTNPDGTPIRGPVIEDAGFPSCLYGPHSNNWPTPNIGGHEHPDNFEPEDNPNTAVTDKFGTCQKDKVLKPIMFFAEGHNGTSGLAFERGSQFPDRYNNDLFVAEWGSIWNLNGGEVTGHKVTHIDIGPDGLPQRKREFLTGGAPIDVTFGPDGALYVADFQGQIYRVASIQDTPDTATIEIQAGQFVPQVVTIPRGTKVLWVNLDAVAHNVRGDHALVARDPADGCASCPANEPTTAAINSPGDIQPRASHAYTFGDLDGAWKYSSTTSAAMHGTVIVAPADR
jgi:glucose/arabinose dehydrogenase